jgi:hypothetical protein
MHLLSELITPIGIYASSHGSTMAFLTLANFTSLETAEQLKDGLDQELKKYENTALAPQLAVQRKLLDDETVPQIEYVLCRRQWIELMGYFYRLILMPGLSAIK